MVFFLLEERGPRGLFVWDLVNGGYMECTIVSKDSGKGNIHACPPISTGESIHIVSSSYTTPCLVLFWSLGRITPPQRSLQITSQREPGNRLAQVYRPLGAFWLDLWMLGVLVFQLEQQNATLFWESTSEPSSKYRIWYNALKAFPPWVLDDMRVLPWDTLMPADLSKAFKLCLLWPFFAAGIVGMSGFPMNLQIHWAHSFFLWRWRYVLKYLCEIHETNRWCLELEIYDSLMKLGFLISIMAHHQY